MYLQSFSWPFPARARDSTSHTITDELAVAVDDTVTQAHNTNKWHNLTLKTPISKNCYIGQWQATPTTVLKGLEITGKSNHIILKEQEDDEHEDNQAQVCSPWIYWNSKHLCLWHKTKKKNKVTGHYSHNQQLHSSTHDPTLFMMNKVGSCGSTWHYMYFIHPHNPMPTSTCTTYS